MSVLVCAFDIMARSWKCNSYERR